MESTLLESNGLATLTWVGIVFCVSQSAMFSGLNLAYFSISRLRLEIDAKMGNKDAAKILEMRQDSNLLLTTILWGNVGINVLLTLLSNSVMAGISAFLFSTLLITLVGEIFPQAYFSRNALRIGALLAPLFRIYQFLLYPVAKPVAAVLDLWLGKEGIQYLRERDIREIIRRHMIADETDLEKSEGLGAMNFLSIDDVPAAQEGEPLDPKSILQMGFSGERPNFPKVGSPEYQDFIQRVQSSSKKWAVIVDASEKPKLVLDCDGYLRHSMLPQDDLDPMKYCHQPIVVSDTTTSLGSVLAKFEVTVEYLGDNVVDRDIILVWAEEKRIITGADILGRLLVGISQKVSRQQPN